MVKENLKKIEDSIKELKNCVDIKKHLPKDVLDKKLNIIECNLKELKEQSKRLSKPQPVLDPDIKGLRKICEEYIDFVASEDYYEDNDFAHYIFEGALETIYGNDIFKWVNNQSR